MVYAIFCGLIAFVMAHGSTLYYINRYENNVVQLYVGGLCGLMTVLLLSKQIKQLPILSFSDVILLLSWLHISFCFPMCAEELICWLCQLFLLC